MKKNLGLIFFLITVSSLAFGSKSKYGLQKELHFELRSNTPYALKWALRPGGLRYEYFFGPPLFIDGEVIVGSYSKAVYFIDGLSGRPARVFNLPESEKGVVGGHNLMAFDVDGDGQKEILFGTEIPPISLYCLNLDRDLTVRWVLPLKGAFICGGLNAVRLDSGKRWIVAGTRRHCTETGDCIRDGTLYLIDGNGKIRYEIGNQDICSNRPTISDINNDGRMEIVYGNHKHQGAEYGGHVIVRNLDDGKLLFATDLKDNTGSNQIAAIDLTGDSKKELIAIADHYSEKVSPAYTGTAFLKSNGDIFWQVDGYNTDVIPASNGKDVLIVGSSSRGKRRLVVLNPKKREIVYQTNNVWLVRGSQALDIDYDGHCEVLATDGANINIVDLATGKIETTLRIPSELSRKNIEFGGITAMSVADCDNDSFLEIICVTTKGFVLCFDTPGKCSKGLEFLHN